MVTGVEPDGEDGVLSFKVELGNLTEDEVDSTSGAALETEHQVDDNEQDGNGDSMRTVTDQGTITAKTEK